MAESRYLAPDSPFLECLVVTHNTTSKSQQLSRTEDFHQQCTNWRDQSYIIKGVLARGKKGVCEATEDRLGSTAWDLGVGEREGLVGSGLPGGGEE